LKWSEEELQILRQKYPEQGSDIEELTENRTKGSIRSKAKRLDISTQKTALDPKTKDKDNFKTGFLVGSLIGDGNIKKNESRISFTQKDEDYIDELITTFNKLTDKKPSKYDSREKYYEISFNSKKWIPVFKDLKSKVLKENSEFSKEFKKGYVTGLFDSEGSVVDNNNCLSLKLSMTEKEPVKKYVEYLKKLGVNVNMREGVCSYNKEKPLYVSEINKYSEIKKFRESINLSIYRKEEKINSYIKLKNKKGTMWNEQEITKLEKNYPEKGVGINLNRPKGSIRSKASKLNIHYKGE